jgi:hypothetical protein
MNSLPPLLPPSSPPPLPDKPGVVLAYRLWCALFVALWLGMGLYGFLQARGILEPDLGLIEGALVRNDPAAKAQLIAEKRQDAVGICVVAGLAAVFYGFAAAVPRKPWGWVVGIVAVSGTVLPFIITAAGMVPILIYWGRPEVKRHFGRL